MNLITTAVRATFYQPDGRPFSGVVISAALTRQDVDDGLLVPTGVTATTDINGVAALALWPNSRGVAGSQYSVSATKNSVPVWSGVITVPEATGSVDMFTLLQILPYPTVDAAQLAALQAQGFAAQSSADAASTAAAAASVAAQVATLAANLVETQAILAQNFAQHFATQ